MVYLNNIIIYLNSEKEYKKYIKWVLKRLYKERGKELKIPHYTSTVTARDGNLPHIKATCLK